MNKKAIAILGAIFVLILGTLGFLIYSRSGQNSNPPNTLPDSQSNNTATGTLPQATITPTPTPTPTLSATGQFYKLTDEQVVSPVLTFDGSGVAYFTTQGELFRASFSPSSSPLIFGDKKQLAIEQKPNVSKVIWPQNSQNFMLEYNVSGKKTWEFYNNDAGKFTLLPPQVYSLSFLPAGDKIYYVWSSQTGNDTVNIADPDTNNYKTISEIWDKNAIVNVSPDGSNVVYYKDPATVSALDNPIVLTDVDGKTWKTLVATGFNSGILWSPDGKKFIFGKRDPASQKYQLWFYNLLSGEAKPLGLYSTPDKAVWSSDGLALYVAVPKSGSAGGGSLTLDSFFKLNPQTLEKKEYDPGSQQIDGRDLFLSKTADKLFFRNAQDGGLYYLDL